VLANMDIQMMRLGDSHTDIRKAIICSQTMHCQYLLTGFRQILNQFGKEFLDCASQVNYPTVPRGHNSWWEHKGFDAVFSCQACSAPLVTRTCRKKCASKENAGSREVIKWGADNSEWKREAVFLVEESGWQVTRV